MIILFDYYFKTDDNMTPNKQFNTYKEGLDLKILRRYYMEYEKVKTSPYGKKLARNVLTFSSFLVVGLI